MTSPNDAGTTATTEEVISFYAKHDKVHPRDVDGRFSRLRKLAVFALLGLFYVVPWLRWDGRQAVLFDMPARKFYIFGLVLWPQDFIFLAWLLVVLGLSLFYFTALAGRLWCGYACPQTVWTEVFLWSERWIEGDRNKRLKLERGGWTGERLRKVAAKQAVWIVFSLWTGVSFVGFFVPITQLLPDLYARQLVGWPLFWTFFYGAATYANAGFMREQVCKYMCPYARFQSAMFDCDTLVITYDEKRGESRGPRPRGIDPRSRGLGDCVDCSICVQVCPTGIDIRNGLQYECIACAACVDACDNVMDKVGYPRGLIRYSTQHALEGRKTHILRLRTLIYTALLLGVIAAGVIGLANRKMVDLDVIRDRNALYRETANDEIENVYLLRVLNKQMRPTVFTLAVEGLDGARIDGGAPRWPVGAGEVYTTAIRIDVPASAVHGGHTIRLVLTDTASGVRLLAEKARFIAPP